MCRRRRGALASIGLIAALAAPGAVEARQDLGPLPARPPAEDLEPYVPAQSEEELLQRIETLRLEMGEAARAYNEYIERERRAAAERGHTPVDTLRIGPLRVIARPDQSDLAREIFGEVWEEEFAHIPESALPENLYFAFQWRVRFDRIRMAPAREREGSVIRVELDRLYHPLRADARVRVHGTISDALVGQLPQDAPVRRWLQFGSDLDWQRAYRVVAMNASGSSAHRGCLAADAAACWTALGLGPDGSVEALGPPGTSAAPRWTLMWHAVSVGGEGAWERLRERADAPPAELLTHVSGLSPEELAAHWAGELEGRRPRLSADLAGDRWIALIWILVFTGLTLRSTRWRLA